MAVVGRESKRASLLRLHGKFNKFFGQLGIRTERRARNFEILFSEWSCGGGGRMPSSSSSNRKVKRKWKSREERSRRIDKEYDVVLVPSDGVCLSGSKSDDSDWSIGWLEPHASDFQSDEEGDGSFTELVPCYRHESKEKEEEEESRIQLLSAVKKLPNDYSAGSNSFVKVLSDGSLRFLASF